MLLSVVFFFFFFEPWKKKKPPGMHAAAFLFLPLRDAQLAIVYRSQSFVLFSTFLILTSSPIQLIIIQNMRNPLEITIPHSVTPDWKKIFLFRFPFSTFSFCFAYSRLSAAHTDTHERNETNGQFKCQRCWGMMNFEGLRCPERIDRFVTASLPRTTASKALNSFR